MLFDPTKAFLFTGSVLYCVPSLVKGQLFNTSNEGLGGAVGTVGSVLERVTLSNQRVIRIGLSGIAVGVSVEFVLK